MFVLPKSKGQQDNTHIKVLAKQGTSEESQIPLEVSYLQKAEIVFVNDSGAENRMILQNTEGLKLFAFPEVPEYSDFIVYDQNERAFKSSFSMFQKLAAGEPSSFTQEERQQMPFFFDGPDLVSDYQFQITEQKQPDVRYADHTEQYVLQFPEIGQDYMESKENGLWSHHGVRLVHFQFMNLPAAAEKIICSLEFNMIDTEQMQNPVIFGNECIQEKKGESAEENKWCEREYIAHINTNVLGKILDDFCPERQYAEFRGYFQVIFKYPQQLGECNEEIYRFPVRLILVNTALQNQNTSYSVLDNTPVSIDFGTSSTCVAINEGKPRLIQLTSMNDVKQLDNIKVNLYETPTNLIVYQWDKLYQQWRKENPLPPLVRRHQTGENSLSDTAHEFDFGYGIKYSLAEADKRFLDAVMTEIKLIPSRSVKEEKQASVNPYHAGKYPLVYLVSDVAQEDETHFNPIAFYGYLLGRAINNPASGKIYTNYVLSYPVKFNEQVRESIRKSLEYGIRRALPETVQKMTDRAGKPLCKAEMKYPEPVAYAGAICDQGALSLDDGIPKLFGVFDFGGGTLDFAFGMYRLSDEEDDKEMDYDSVLEIFGVDGDENIGGEHLIHLLSYWIICQNKEVFGETNIPFVIPAGEDIPDGYDHLFQREGKATSVAKANILRLNEAVSRNLFIGESIVDKSGEIRRLNIDDTAFCELSDTFVMINQYSEPVEIPISFDMRVLYENLQSRIQQAVELFGISITNIFNQSHSIEAMKKQNLTEGHLNVFLAGNTCRHPLVREEMEKIIDAENIFVVGTEEDDEYTRYKITPKTAVAMGQAILNGSNCLTILHTDTENPPYARCVAKKKLNSYEWIIEKNETDASWRRIGVISGNVTIFYSFNADHSDVKTLSLYFPEEDNGKICFIRPHQDTSIAYIAVPKKQNPEDFEETAEYAELP